MAQRLKKSPANVGDVGGEMWVDPWVGKRSPWRNANPLHDSCLKSPHGQRGVEAGYSHRSQEWMDLMKLNDKTKRTLEL